MDGGYQELEPRNSSTIQKPSVVPGLPLGSFGKKDTWTQCVDAPN